MNEGVSTGSFKLELTFGGDKSLIPVMEVLGYNLEQGNKSLEEQINQGNYIAAVRWGPVGMCSLVVNPIVHITKMERTFYNPTAGNKRSKYIVPDQERYETYFLNSSPVDELVVEGTMQDVNFSARVFYQPAS